MKTPTDVLTRSNAAFGLDLYRRLADSSRDNLFFSPYSISLALATTYAGARGLTRREMAAALDFQEPDKRLHAEFAELTRSLNELSKSGKVKLSVANALWGQKGLRFLPEFLELGRRRIINAWVEKETQQKIEVQFLCTMT